jgi:hypothetical protein
VIKKRNKFSLKSILLITLGLFFVSVDASSTIEQISFNGSRILIEHQGCLPDTIIQEKNKLIIPLLYCSTQAAEKNVLHDNLKKIHWAQHDAHTVWVVATFANAYQFETRIYPNQYIICLSHCGNKHKQEKAILSENPQTLFNFNGLNFIIPLENMSIEAFLDRSIGFTPADIVKDGLPHFGSKRDDWKGKARKHKGYDIYVDNINVISPAQGVVIQVEQSLQAGLYIKLHHGYDFYTLYVHVAEAFVKPGQKVEQNTLLGRIDGPRGNAIAPQLHFEIKIKDKSLDPLPFIEDFYKGNPFILEKITHYKALLPELIRDRDKKVREFLSR